jgi:protein disulfide-isomerase A1
VNAGCCPPSSPAPQEAAATLASNSDIALAKIDATEEGPLAERYGVQGYPTLKWYSGDKDALKEYTGGRTADEIVAWVTKKTGPPATVLADAAALEAFKKDNEVAVVFSGPAGADKDAFLAQAAADDDTAYGEMAGAAAAVTLYKQFDEGENKFEGAVTTEALAAFVATNSVPVLMEFNDDTVKKIFGSPIEGKALLFVDTEDAGFEGIKKQYQAVAEANRGKVVFAYVNKDKSQVLEYFGLTEKDLPSFFILRMDDKGGDMVKYRHEGDVAGIGAYVATYLAGDAKPFLKSEPAPEPNDAPVTIVVGSNINDIVGKDKDVLLEFYAPWCGHCKSLAPKYEKLGKKFAAIDSVVIAKGDATANDYMIDGKPVDVSGFPTILFYPAGSTEPISYDGARSVKGMTKFIQENAKTSFELPKKEKKKEGDDAEAKEDL